MSPPASLSPTHNLSLSPITAISVSLSLLLLLSSSGSGPPNTNSNTIIGPIPVIPVSATQTLSECFTALKSDSPCVLKGNTVHKLNYPTLLKDLADDLYIRGEDGAVIDGTEELTSAEEGSGKNLALFENPSSTAWVKCSSLPDYAHRCPDPENTFVANVTQNVYQLWVEGEGFNTFSEDYQKSEEYRESMGEWTTSNSTSSNSSINTTFNATARLRSKSRGFAFKIEAERELLINARWPDAPGNTNSGSNSDSNTNNDNEIPFDSDLKSSAPDAPVWSSVFSSEKSWSKIWDGWRGRTTDHPPVRWPPGFAISSDVATDPFYDTAAMNPSDLLVFQHSKFNGRDDPDPKWQMPYGKCTLE
jgi:hypothetical protein